MLFWTSSQVAYVFNNTEGQDKQESCRFQGPNRSKVRFSDQILTIAPGIVEVPQQYSTQADYYSVAGLSPLSPPVADSGFLKKPGKLSAGKASRLSSSFLPALHCGQAHTHLLC